ncbi:MAG: phosphodiester glycosidase family protein [Microscillaceae bacterium]|jgi:hypothetical protein|nr:phosphodiester glycosidase family protein [Microscillaceae bacterium]
MKSNLILKFVIGCLVIGVLACEKRQEPTPLVNEETENNSSFEKAVGVPTGFFLLAQTTGVKLYKKNYTGGQPDYVQEIDLTKAKVKLLQTGLNATTTQTSPCFVKRLVYQNSGSTLSYWNQFIGSNPKMFSIVNLQFFGDPGDKCSSTRDQMAFPIKQANTLISVGYGNNESYQKRSFELYSTYANITETYTNTSNAYSAVASALGTAPTVAVGLHPTLADKGVNIYKPRTFIGIRDKNGDGKCETLYIYASKLARQTDARQVLLDFGCLRTIMFDGGGSTQLCYKKADGIVTTPIYTSRTVPSALAVIGG